MEYEIYQTIRFDLMILGVTRWERVRLQGSNACWI